MATLLISILGVPIPPYHLTTTTSDLLQHVVCSLRNVRYVPGMTGNLIKLT